jgi:hypothetical protein
MNIFGALFTKKQKEREREREREREKRETENLRPKTAYLRMYFYIPT